jgi:glycyl-tRNA synthetase beta subunit
MAVVQLVPSPAADNLLRLVSINVKENGLKFENAYTYYSARRLVLILYNLDAYSKDVVEEKLGPRIDAPERAIKGFLDANNLSTVDQCNIKSDVKGDRYSFLRKIPKRDAEKILQGFDKKNKVSMGQDQKINQHSPDYGYIFVDVSGQNYEVQIRPIPKFADHIVFTNSKKRIKLNG